MKMELVNLLVYELLDNVGHISQNLLALLIFGEFVSQLQIALNPASLSSSP